MKKKFLSIFMAFCMVLSLCSVTAFAADENTSGLPDASDGIITLTEDVTLSSTHEITSDLTIDLNGHTITGDNVRALWVKSGTLTLTGSGTVTTVAAQRSPIADSSSVIRVGDSSEKENKGDAKLVIGSGVNVKAPATYGVTVFGKNSALKLDVEGTVTATGPASAISGNGTAGLSATNITIKSGATVSAGSEDTATAAIYQPQAGTLTIEEGATVTSSNGAGIVARSGNVVIHGGTISGNGSGNFTVGDNDIELTKSAAVYDSLAGYPGLTGHDGGSGLTISGGTFGADAGVDAVAVVAPENTGSQNISVSISGGTFSSDVSKYLGGEQIAVKQDDGTYGVEVLGEKNAVACITKDETTTYYKTLADAIKQAEDGNTITLLKDAAGCGIIVASKKYSTTGMTIDFNGHTYTVDEGPLAGSAGTQSQCFQLLTGGSVTMKNGTIVDNVSGSTMMVQNYCNLTLDHMNLDATAGTNSVGYVLSNNCGNATIDGTTIKAKSDGVAFDVYGGFQSYGDVSVTVKGDSKISGKVEVARAADSQNVNKNKLVIQGGTFDGELSVTSDEKTTVNISGGDFSQSVSKYVDDSLSAELISSDVDNTTPYSYYKNADEAKAAAKPGDLIVDLSQEAPQFQILGVGFDATAKGANDAMTKMLKSLGGTSEVTDSDENTMWAFLKLTGTADNYTLTVTDASGNAVYTSTQSDGLESAQGIHCVYFTFDPNGGSHTEKGIASGTYTVTLTTGAGADAKNETATITIAEVSYDLNNGSGTIPDATYYTAGTALTLAAAPTRSGYTFSGWYTNGAKAGDAGAVYKVPDDAVRLIAQWTSNSSGGGGGSSSGGYAVSISPASNGSVKVSPKNASKGDTVTVTVKPDTGYELDKLTVTDKNGDNINLTEKGNDKYTFTMPSGKVTVKATFAKVSEKPQPGVSFNDVPASAYYYDAVEWAAEKGITGGTSATTFSPDAGCTRAQIVTFLWRANGSPKVTGANPFTDVQAGSYYYDAVLWAVTNGITSGTSATTFAPDATVTRGQTVTFLHRASGSPAASGNNPFTDVASGTYYTAAVQWAVAEGITSGTSATTFAPDAACTRAQIVTFLYRDLVD